MDSYKEAADEHKKKTVEIYKAVAFATSEYNKN